MPGRIYRNEQAQLSISGEAGVGGYLETATGTDVVGGGGSTVSNAAAVGDRYIRAVSVVNYAVGDYIQTVSSDTSNQEIRRIIRIDGTTLYLDFPIGFNHASGASLNEITAPFTRQANYSTFLPGVYETFKTPDLEPTLLPQYLISTTSLRNFSTIYRGEQKFLGNVSNLILLNGFPLRFPIGGVRTTVTPLVGGASATTIATTAVAVGDLRVTLTSAAGYVSGDIIIVDTIGTNPEVRRVVTLIGSIVVVNYPFLFPHAIGANVDEAGASPIYTHTIVETLVLGTMTWHVQMRDTDGTTANDFVRKFIGGAANRATISAEQGKYLTMSFDDVMFLDLVHNQDRHSTIHATNDDVVYKSSRALVLPGTGSDQTINNGIGGALGAASNALTGATFPTNEPYYFSQGDVSLFGVVFARIRDFRLEINNNVQPYYFIRATNLLRGPSRFVAQKREYRMFVTIAMPDSISANAVTRTLWKELILEGNYDGITGVGPDGNTGFDISLVFTRGTNDTITITSPPSAAGSGIEAQGCFFIKASHDIGTESPVQVEGEILLRSLQIVVVDSEPVYP